MRFLIILFSLFFSTSAFADVEFRLNAGTLNGPQSVGHCVVKVGSRDQRTGEFFSQNFAKYGNVWNAKISTGSFESPPFTIKGRDFGSGRDYHMYIYFKNIHTGEVEPRLLKNNIGDFSFYRKQNGDQMIRVYTGPVPKFCFYKKPDINLNVHVWEEKIKPFAEKYGSKIRDGFGDFLVKAGQWVKTVDQEKLKTYYRVMKQQGKKVTEKGYRAWKKFHEDLNKK